MTDAPANSAPAAAAPAAAAPAATPANTPPAASPASPAAAPAGDKPAINADALKINDALAKPDADAKKAPDQGDGKGDAPGEKKEGAEQAEKKEGEEGKDADKKAPEYSEFKLPEGYQAIPENLESATALFKELNLNQDQAQKVVDNFIQIQERIEAGWVKDINDQWDTFTKDAEFYKDGKLTPAAEQAFGAVRNLSANTQSFFNFLNKNGGLFHPGFVELTRLVSKGTGEGKFREGKDTPETKKGDPQTFYAKSEHK
jgi:predicted small secreted protein